MKPHCERDHQFELFDTPAPLAELAPKLVLPFQRSEEVDINRVARILGVNRTTVCRMLEAGVIHNFRIGRGRPRIEYNSVVEYCDRLRVEYRISSRAVLPLKGRRHRDRDLLPFPLDETIGVSDVRAMLDCPRETVQFLIEEGTLIGYKLSDSGSPWRIWKRSVERSIARGDLIVRKFPVAPLR